MPLLSAVLCRSDTYCTVPQVMGSHLRSFEYDRDVWLDALNVLYTAVDVPDVIAPEHGLVSSFYISYNGLNNKIRQRMFLDAACSFLGRRRETAERAWLACAPSAVPLHGMEECSTAGYVGLTKAVAGKQVGHCNSS